MKRSLYITLLLLAVAAWPSLSCKKDPIISNYRTKHVVIILIDGARFTETWGDEARQYIPERSNYLAPLGTYCTNMYNDGGTYTEAGYTAFMRGAYESISNNGAQYPTQPSFMQYWLKNSGQPSEKAWIVTSKDKLQVQGDCIDPVWAGQYKPRTDCGINGLFTGYRDDSVTLRRSKEVMRQYHPDLMVIGFKEPDASGHSGNWTAYLQGIMSTDAYCREIWDLLQADPYYAGTTTLMILNDHGRHTAGHLDGFVSHGDNCMGCKQIEFMAVGPDIKEGYMDAAIHSQVDVAVTAAGLMGVEMKNVTGRMMDSMLKKEKQ